MVSLNESRAEHELSEITDESCTLDICESLAKTCGQVEHLVHTIVRPFITVLFSQLRKDYLKTTEQINDTKL